MAWVILVFAGLLEMGWAIGLKYTDGFTRPLPSVFTALGIAASLFLLSIAVRTIPIGTAPRADGLPRFAGRRSDRAQDDEPRVTFDDTFDRGGLDAALQGTQANGRFVGVAAARANA